MGTEAEQRPGRQAGRDTALIFSYWAVGQPTKQRPDLRHKHASRANKKARSRQTQDVHDPYWLHGRILFEGKAKRKTQTQRNCTNAAQAY